MESTLIGYRMRIKPSDQLISFILSLKDEKIMPKNIFKVIQAYDCKTDVEKETQETETFNFENDETTDNKMEFFQDHRSNENDFDNFNSDEMKIAQTQENDENVSNTTSNDEIESKIEYNQNSETETDESESDTKLLLGIDDVQWIKRIVEKRYGDKPSAEYLDDLLRTCELISSVNEIISSNPESETRRRKVRDDEDEVTDFRGINENVVDEDDEEDRDEIEENDVTDDSVRLKVKVFIRQLFAILQFIISIVGGFAFGFIGVELVVGTLDYGFRLLLGVIFALTVALVEIYFLAKKLVEYDDLLPTSYDEKEKQE